MASEDRIKDVIRRYQETFSAGDKDGWLGLFADGASVEDPVGSAPRLGKEELGAFWDETHAMLSAIDNRVVQGPAVSGNEAAFAFEAHLTVGDHRLVLPIIDVMTFDDDARITSMRAFVDQAGMRPAN